MGCFGSPYRKGLYVGGEPKYTCMSMFGRHIHIYICAFVNLLGSISVHLHTHITRCLRFVACKAFHDCMNAPETGGWRAFWYSIAPSFPNTHPE